MQQLSIQAPRADGPVGPHRHRGIGLRWNDRIDRSDHSRHGRGVRGSSRHVDPAAGT